MISTSKVEILLSSLDPDPKSFVPSKSVKCSSVFSCCVKEVFVLLENKKSKVFIPINLLAEPKPEFLKRVYLRFLVVG